jgi:hypothetical protein
MRDGMSCCMHCIDPNNYRPHYKLFSRKLLSISKLSLNIEIISNNTTNPRMH